MPRILRFYDRFVDPILERTKTHTLRARTLVKPGELVSLRAWKGKAFRAGSKQVEILLVECKSVDPVFFEVDRRNGRVHLKLDGEWLDPMELLLFVWADGFNSIEDFCYYHIQKGTTQFDGVVITWRHLEN